MPISLAIYRTLWTKALGQDKHQCYTIIGCYHKSNEDDTQTETEEKNSNLSKLK